MERLWQQKRQKLRAMFRDDVYGNPFGLGLHDPELCAFFEEVADQWGRDV